MATYILAKVTTKLVNTNMESDDEGVFLLICDGEVISQWYSVTNEEIIQAAMDEDLWKWPSQKDNGHDLTHWNEIWNHHNGNEDEDHELVVIVRHNYWPDQHTAGPWNSRQSGTFGAIEITSPNYQTASTHDPLARVYPASIATPEKTLLIPERSFVQAEANARLISAAPDLLDALRTILSEIEERLETLLEIPYHKITKARAAITKATAKKEGN